jgi:hypothetical protein
MSDLFLYSVVKFVPHPVRDEAVNVGVVLTAESGEHVHHRFAVAYRKKIAALAPDVDPRTAERAVQDFRSRYPEDLGQVSLGGTPQLLSPERLQALSEEYGYQIRFTDPRPVMVDDVSRSLEELYGEFVGGLPGRARSAPGKSRVRHAVLERFRRWEVPKERILERPRVPVRHGTNWLDTGLARAEGDLAIALEPISFSIKSTDEVLRQRDHVALVAADADHTAGDFLIGAVLGEPSTQLEEIHQESVALLRAFNVVTVTEEELDDLGPVLRQSGVVVGEG